MPSQRCAYCNRRFARAEHLLRHARSHTKEKPFKCGTCGKTYARDDTLIRHAKSHSMNWSGKMTLLEASSNLGEDGAVRNEEQSAGRITPLSTPGNMAFLNTIEISQTQLQDTAKSTSSPVQHIADLSTGANLCGLNHIEFMNESPLWAINSNFLMNEGDAAGTFGQSHNSQLQDPNYSSNNHVSDGYLETIHPPVVSDLRNVWFTRIYRSEESLCDPPLSRLARESISRPAWSPSEPELVDEECRLGLTNALISAFPRDDFLPSSEFLNLCVRRYLKCFNPIFPIIHVGTFQPAPENRLLLISMASVGCLFWGSQAAVQRGHRIFETLNRAILASWENVVGRTSDESLAMVQAAIIGQTFAMLSGDARHSAIFDTYHGSLISFARREKMFEPCPDTSLPEDLSGDELEAAWKKWARREEVSRVSFALKVHDAELSALLHREPLLKHVISQDPLLMRARPFLATTAANWASAAKQDAAVWATGVGGVDRPHLPDFFAVYVKLEDIGVNIAEDRRQGCLDEAALNSYQQILQRWHNSYAEFAGEEQPDQSRLIILWHWTYMALLVDFDKLESAVGRDGPEAAHDAIAYVLSWASTPNSSRCMLHAFLIQKQLQLLRFDDVPAIHAPRIAFSASIAWHCFIHHGRDNDAFKSSLRLINTAMPELGALGPDSHSHLSYISSLRWSRGAMSSIKAATLCELGGLLQRMNEWGLAKKFAGIVACLIDGELQGETTY